MLRFPPESALAIVEGDGADDMATALSSVVGLDVVRHRDRWLVRATDSGALADAFADVRRPAGVKTRIEVDPPRI